MTRLELMAILVAAALMASFVLYFGSSGSVRYEAPSAVPASSPAVLATTTTSTLLPSLPPIAVGSSSASEATRLAFPAPATPPSSPKKSTNAAPAVVTKPVASTPVAPAYPPASSTPPAETPVEPSSGGSLAASASALREALVNIICLAPAGGPIRSISASGVFIGSMGYILTNAHVAQYFLLADQGVSCSIRVGDPAKNSYKAMLAFIPAAWVEDNASVITEPAPSGTGERDFALLGVSGSATAAPLPSSFPTVPLAYAAPAAGTSVVIGSYAAQFLEFSQIISALSPTLAYGSVKQILTFGGNTPDVLALGGSAAAQEGSSGGGIANAAGILVGDITTSTVTGDTATRSLSADTAAYIRREYQAETGQSLDALLATPPLEAITAFVPKAPALEALLLAALGKK